MPRIRTLGLLSHHWPTGAHNAITDVAGVAVGQVTILKGEGEWQRGQGPFRTGVTVILPHQGNLYENKVPAAVHTINGFGKAVGFEQIRELGNIETPIALTSTLNVPRVADALITLAIEQSPHIGVGFAENGRLGWGSVNPVVGETNDGFLNDMQGRPVGLAEVRQAIAAASTDAVGEGAVGAGTGTSCYGWKGGIGTASRALPTNQGGYVVGALVQTNFGRPEELVIDGVPIGRFLHPDHHSPRTEDGSIMIVLATNAPMNGRQLKRLCKRATFGLARTGSTCHGGSGDFVIAFSTAHHIPDHPASRQTTQSFLYEQSIMSAFARATAEAVEEAIYNSLFMAETVIGRDGNTRVGLPVAEVVRLVQETTNATHL
ncbi:MAG: P1 family peptidase [Chloroflexota bacterium]